MTLQFKRKTIGLRRFIFPAMLLIFASISAVAQTNTFPQTGNAGAGTTSPDRKLEVLDSGSPQIRLTHTGGSVYTDFQTLSSGNLIISPTGPDTTSPKPFTVSAASDAFRFYPSADTNLRWSLTTDASGLFNIVQRGDGWANQGTRLSINRSGNVGIGTTSPIYTLDVNGGVNGFRARAATTSSSDAIATFENSSGIQAIVRGNGNVGIGTLNPAFDANVTKYLALDGGGYLGSIGVGGNITSTSHPVGQYAFFNSGLGGSEKRVATIVGGTDLATNSGKIDFWTTSAGSFGSGPKMTIFSNGNVGINTNNPAAYKLDVNGEINATGIRINGIPISGGGSSQWTTSGSNIYYNSGNVGVGLASPRTYAALDINTSNSKSLYTMDSTNGGLLIGYQGSTIQARQTDDGNSQNLILQNWGGNVGIGTATPAYKLHVQGGQINASGGLCIAGDCKSAWSQIGGGGSSQWSDGANSTIYYNTGNVGIGTPTPDNPLTVKASGSSTHGFAVKNNALTQYLTYIGPRGSGGTAQNQGLLAVADQGTSTVVLDAAGPSYFNGGNVGIGTTSPTMLLGDSNGLHISGSYPGLRLTATGSGGHDYFFATGSSGQLVLYDNTSAATRMFFNSSGNVGIGITNVGNTRVNIQGVDSTSSNFGLYVQNSSNAAILAVRNDGNVGIGNSSPTEKLHVTGNGKVTGNLTVDGTINAKYQDLAEWVPSSEQLSAGTVVVLDTTKSNQVVSATVAYDTRVAGVISAQPGITLGESGEGRVLVATTGRVRVKVDASRGPIQIGDLLVTSDVSGVAMKSEAVEFAGRKMHMPGTIIGKALEPLAKGSGEILVLLSLQ